MHSIFARLNDTDTSHTPKIALCKSCRTRAQFVPATEEYPCRHWFCPSCRKRCDVVRAYAPNPIHAKETRTHRRDYDVPGGPASVPWEEQTLPQKWQTYAHIEIRLTSHERSRTEKLVADALLKALDWDYVKNSLKPRIDWEVTPRGRVSAIDKQDAIERKARVLIAVIMQMSCTNHGQQPNINYARLARCIFTTRRSFSTYQDPITGESLRRPLLRFVDDVRAGLEALES